MVEGHSQWIGVDQKIAASYIFNCNPYVQKCLIGGTKKYNGAFVVTLQWFNSIGVAFFTVWQLVRAVFPEVSISFGPPFPWIRGSVFKVFVILWMVLTAIISVTGAGIAILGIITNIFQAPLALMKAYTVMASLNMFVFLFINWLLMLAIGYFVFFVENYSFTDRVARAWYFSFIVQIVGGALSIQTINSIRYWYWDEYYGRDADGRRARAIAEAEASGFFDYDWYGSEEASELDEGNSSSGWSNGGSGGRPSGGIDFRQTDKSWMLL